MKCNRHVVKWENSPESSPGRSDASGCRNQPNDQRLAGENPESALCLVASQDDPHGCRVLIVVVCQMRELYAVVRKLNVCRRSAPATTAHNRMGIGG